MCRIVISSVQCSREIVVGILWIDVGKEVAGALENHLAKVWPRRVVTKQAFELAEGLELRPRQ